MKLSGNTILITGGTSGIGLGFAEEFHKLGNKVIICGRRADRLAEITKKHEGIIAKQVDISKSNEREMLADWAITNYPEINILINNAGVQLNANFLKGIEINKLNQEVETNFTAPVHLTSLFVKHLMQKPSAAIINISSGLAFAPLAFLPVYCATKAAIHSFTKSLRFQLKDSSVKVFEIAPPAVDTELGLDRKTDKSQSHGGISVSEFLSETMDALKNDIYEATIGTAKGLKEDSEKMFLIMNQR
jgi:uncharacterized oxidoreductase